MHNYFDYTIDVCNQAEKAFLEDLQRKRKEQKKLEGLESTNDSFSIDTEFLDHNCHRHWAFALFKRSEMGKAIKQIKKK